MGLTHFDDYGHEVISHGGGINGFLSETRYYPQDDLYIICLVNTTGPHGAGYFSNQLVWKLLNKQEPTTTPVNINQETVKGNYSGMTRGQKISMKVTPIESGIILQHDGEERSDTVKTYIGNDTWMDGNTIIKFKEDALRIDQISGYYILKKQ